MNISGVGRGSVPAQKAMRDKLRGLAADFAAHHQITAPVSLDELRAYCRSMVRQYDLRDQYTDFLAICLNNAIWKDAVASTPFEKRLLLIPKCLRHSRDCPGQFDRFGLVCAGCGRCVIHSVSTMAKTLGYTVLIAEGSPIVMSLISSGQIQAVIGVSCLTVLEQTFPYMEAGAVAGIAVPLLYDGCEDTALDVDWLEEALTDYRHDGCKRTDLHQLKQQVHDLFTKENLERYFGSDTSQTARIAMDWMAFAGKRFRPIIAAAVYDTLGDSSGEQAEALPGRVCEIAVAIECFHKASLIHDDIEDSDEYRSGGKTLHIQHGIPVALNTGDYLLGMGYRLIANADVEDCRKIKMLQAASEAHYQLCVGQGNELTWLNDPVPLRVDQVLEIFEKKTSPAFEVALKLGLLLTEDLSVPEKSISDYSRNLGISYQILDDINDFDVAVQERKFSELKPSLLYALAWRDADSRQKSILAQIHSHTATGQEAHEELMKVFGELSVKRKALDMLETFKTAAIDSIRTINHTSLKSLLRILISIIFNEIEIMSCCDDYPPGND